MGGGGGRVGVVEFLWVRKVVATWCDGAGLVVGGPDTNEEDVENGRLSFCHWPGLEVLGCVEEPLRRVAEESYQ